METSLKIKFLTLLLIPFITCAGILIYTLVIEQSYNDFPIDSSMNTAKTSEDTGTVRAIAVRMLEGYHSTNMDNVELYYSLVQFLLYIAIINAALLYSIYTFCQRNVSNKSLKQTD